MIICCGIIVTEFELGELAGNIKNILLLAGITKFKVQMINENNSRIFQITVVFEEIENVEVASGTSSYPDMS